MTISSTVLGANDGIGFISLLDRLFVLTRILLLGKGKIGLRRFEYHVGRFHSETIHLII